MSSVSFRMRFSRDMTGGRLNRASTVNDTLSIRLIEKAFAARNRIRYANPRATVCCHADEPWSAVRRKYRLCSKRSSIFSFWDVPRTFAFEQAGKAQLRGQLPSGQHPAQRQRGSWRNRPHCTQLNRTHSLDNDGLDYFSNQA